MEYARRLGIALLATVAILLAGAADTRPYKPVRADPGHLGWVHADRSAILADTGDYGDAPDPPYPTRHANDGARHLDASHEWLGDGVDAEPDARPDDSDLFDDGVSLHGPYLAGDAGRIDFDVHVLAADGDRYGPEPGRQIYVNAWFDWNRDGDWDDTDEHAVSGLTVSPDQWEPGQTDQWVTGTFTVPNAVADGLLWIRARLDYGENVAAPDGLAQFGEVEDYRTDTLRVPSQYPDIQTALDTAQPHDAVLVAPGVFQGPMVVQGDHLSLRGAGADSTLIVVTVPVGAAGDGTAQAIIQAGPMDEFKIRDVALTLSEPIQQADAGPARGATSAGPPSAAAPEPSAVPRPYGRSPDAIHPSRGGATAWPMDTATATATATSSATPSPTASATATPRPGPRYGILLDGIRRFVARNVTITGLSEAGIAGNAKYVEISGSRLASTPTCIQLALRDTIFNVAGGTLDHCGTGIDAAGTGDIDISAVVSSDNSILARIALLGKLRMAHNRSLGDTVGVQVDLTGRGLFAYNSIGDSEQALSVAAGGVVTFERNEFFGNNTALLATFRAGTEVTSSFDDFRLNDRSARIDAEANVHVVLRNATVDGGGGFEVTLGDSASWDMSNGRFTNTFGAAATWSIKPTARLSAKYNTASGSGQHGSSFTFGLEVSFVADAVAAGTHQDLGTIEFRDNTLTRNNGYGIYVPRIPDGMRLDVRGNRIVANSLDGILVGPGASTFHGNLVCYNLGDGVRVTGPGADLGGGFGGDAGENVLARNGPIDLRNLAATGLPAQGNDWGQTTTAEMAAKGYPANIGAIYDFFDQEGLGMADYSEWRPASLLCDWLDYGDAPDPPYRSLALRNGPCHLDPRFEWLGPAVDIDPDARLPGPDAPGDAFDDGVTTPELVVAGESFPIAVRINTSGLGPTRYGPTQGLYLTGWYDWTADGDWDDPGEQVVAWSGGPGLVDSQGDPWPVAETARTVSFTISPPLVGEALHARSTSAIIAARFRLSYGEPADTPLGMAIYGEVEDYALTYAIGPVTPGATATGTLATPGATETPTPSAAPPSATPTATMGQTATLTREPGTTGTPTVAPSATVTATATRTTTRAAVVEVFLPFAHRP